MQFSLLVRHFGVAQLELYELSNGMSSSIAVFIRCRVPLLYLMSIRRLLLRVLVVLVELSIICDMTIHEGGFSQIILNLSLSPQVLFHVLLIGGKVSL